jgi:hypothetical protein
MKFNFCYKCITLLEILLIAEKIKKTKLHNNEIKKIINMIIQFVLLVSIILSMESYSF